MDDYDAIVIGSGSGGLIAALALARAGQRVVVYEQHYLPGGYSQSFTIDGFSFSPGIHYIGQLGPGGTLRRIYEGLGLADELVFLELDPDGYDRVFIGDERFDIPAGRERFADRLKRRFPREVEGIDAYMRAVRRMSDELSWTNPEGLGEALKMPLRMPATVRHGLLPLGRFLDGITRDPLLRAILSIQAGDHGMAPARVPTVVHAALQDYYFDGGCYPRGGGHAIPDAIIRQLRERGGEIELDTEVERISIAGGRVTGVRLADGREVRARVVISNADPGVTWGRLIEPQHLGARLRHRLARQRYSVSTVSVFMAVDMDLRAAGIDSGNVWFSRTPDIDACYRVAERGDFTQLPELPGIFFSATTLKDPSLRSDGLHTVEAMALATPRSFARWRDLPRGHRGDDYAALKRRLAEQMIAAIERFVPGFGDHVVFRSVATPLTNMHFLRASEGGIYGTEKTLGNVGPFAFPLETHIPGLYQCGASTLAAGINGVSKSGLHVAARVLGCRPDELLDARGRPLRILPADDPGSWPDALRPSAPAPAAG